MCRALVSKRITLYLITEENQDEVRSMLEKAGDAYTLGEFEKSYLPEFEDGRQTMRWAEGSPTSVDNFRVWHAFGENQT